MNNDTSLVVSSLRLRQFRSYADAVFEFDPGVNIIVGPNASGKTTIVEALLVMARGHSYKAKDADLLTLGADWARLDAQCGNGTRIIKLRREHNLIKKQYELDERVFQRLTMAHMVPIVLFEPNHLLQLTTQPELRRSLLDDLLEQIRPDYGSIRRQYKRCLAQRNALLKSDRPVSPDDLFVWNLRLSEYGGIIARERIHLLAQFNARMSDVYGRLAGDEQSTVELRYESDCSPEQYETDLLRQLELRFDTDRQRGFTTRGPHRDDMGLQLRGLSVADTASRGEARTLMLSFKILEAELLETARAQRPLLLLDDVFSELDGRRRRALTGYLENYQTFITTTDADVVVEHFGQTCRVIALGS